MVVHRVHGARLRVEDVETLFQPMIAPACLRRVRQIGDVTDGTAHVEMARIDVFETLEHLAVEPVGSDVPLRHFEIVDFEVPADEIRVHSFQPF